MTNSTFYLNQNYQQLVKMTNSWTKRFLPSPILMDVEPSLLIWGSTAGVYLESPILLQKKCIRIISKVGYYDHTGPLFKDHKILPVLEIYDYNCVNFIFQC